MHHEAVFAKCEVTDEAGKGNFAANKRLGRNGEINSSHLKIMIIYCTDFI